MTTLRKRLGRIKFLSKLYIKLVKGVKKNKKAKYKDVKCIPKTECVKLHLGCGRNYHNGWINIDISAKNKIDLKLDLTKPLPFKENSVDFIYSERCFEHFSVDDGLALLKESLRVLKPEGVIRLSMPDLKDIISIYSDTNWKDKNKEYFMKNNLEFVQTRAEYINIVFRWWGHKWIYDYEEIERKLIESGAINIKRCEVSCSEHPELQNIETRLVESLIVEAQKL